ncbi:MAG: hypothetical protein KAJ18_06885 [Candidatus Omnitrophica bacterium]|nr:hypothetical protein [Candidatus Omnitrophota bacterium]
MSKNFILAILLACIWFFFYHNQEPGWKDSFAQGSYFIIEVEPGGDAIADKKNIKRIKEFYEYRFKEVGVKKQQRVIKAINERKVVIQLPYIPLSDSVTKFLFEAVADLEFKLIEDNPVLLKAALEGNIPAGLTLEYFKDGEPILFSSGVILDESNIKDATVEAGGASFNTPVVMLRFNKKGARDFAKITGDNIGSRLAIILDGEILSAPKIREPVVNGRVQITGQFTMEEAGLLALSLRAGALPGFKLVESGNLTKKLWAGK